MELSEPVSYYFNYHLTILEVKGAVHCLANCTKC